MLEVIVTSVEFLAKTSVHRKELISLTYRNDLPSSQTVKHQWHEWQTALSVVVHALETKK